MEDNQEHKLDSFFKKSLENQAFTPPENLWSSIASETIAKESTGSPLVKYGIVSLGLMILAGVAFWWLTNDTVFEANRPEIASVATAVQPPQEFEKESGATAESKSIVDNVKPEKDGVSTSEKQLISFVNHDVAEASVKSITDKKSIVQSKKATYPDATTLVKNNDINTKHSTNQTSVQTDDNNMVVLAKDSKAVNNNLYTLYHKDLVLKDISARNHKNLLGKIRPVQQLTDAETSKHEYKPASTGSKFSLKHPIVSFDYGVLSNTWEFKSENSLVYNVVYPEKNTGTFLKANIAWKITEKSRMGISAAYNSYNLGTPYFNIPIWSSYFGVPTVYLNTKNGKQYYNAIMPVGTVNIPAEKFAEIVKLSPDTIFSSRKMVFSDEHRMTTFTLGITTQNDLLTLQSKKKKYLNLKIYGIADFTFQRQITYHYAATDFLTMMLSSTTIAERGRITYDSNHLENASDFIFGIRAGLGIRWQFAPKLGLHIEGTSQNSFNTWVQNQELKTYMRSNAFQAGVNLSL